MCTHNGEEFLAAQLRSLEEQTFPAIDVWVSDDASSDSTREMLEDARRRWTKGRFEIVEGPRKGFAENFRSLMIKREIEADFYAFCDQDDLWDADKLTVAIEWLDSLPQGEPALYCGRTRSIDSEDHEIGSSELFTREPSFRNAIVQSIAGGNTMVYNRAAQAIIAEASRRSSFVSHDWWCYLLVTGAGGIVRYDAEPRIGYRQHGSNIVGENKSPLARFKRFGFLFQGGFAEWIDRNLDGLQANRDLLTEDARAVLDRVRHLRQAGLVQRMVDLNRAGVYRQTSPGTLGVYLASALNRF